MSGACRAQDDVGQPNARAPLPSRGPASRVISFPRADRVCLFSEIFIRMELVGLTEDNTLRFPMSQENLAETTGK